MEQASLILTAKDIKHIFLNNQIHMGRSTFIDLNLGNLHQYSLWLVWINVMEFVILFMIYLKWSLIYLINYVPNETKDVNVKAVNRIGGFNG